MEIELLYTSLTSKMLAAAEAWETGLAYIDEEGFLQCDERRFAPIYCKYNPDLPEMVLARLKQELEIAGVEHLKLYGIWDATYSNIQWLIRFWPELSVEQFAPKLIEPILIQMKKDDEGCSARYSRKILEELGAQQIDLLE